MKFNRKNIINTYPWILDKKRSCIISANYDGLICASFLHHFLGWNIEGYYDYESIWISKEGIKNKKDLIWVDLNILPKQGKSIGGHIISLNGEIPNGFKSSCNPNSIIKLTINDFEQKFPFSTILFLCWLMKKKFPKQRLAQLLLLHSDSSWLKIQKYKKNVTSWTNILENYDWDFIQHINSKSFEKNVDLYLYPKLHSLGATSGYSKLKSNYLNLYSREFFFNPDWDEDIIIKLFSLFAKELKWTMPDIPLISKRINGKKIKVPISRIKKYGINNYLKSKKVFSYAFISNKTFSYTTFK